MSPNSGRSQDSELRVRIQDCTGSVAFAWPLYQRSSQLSKVRVELELELDAFGILNINQRYVTPGPSVWRLEVGVELHARACFPVNRTSLIQRADYLYAQALPAQTSCPRSPPAGLRLSVCGTDWLQ